MHGPGKYDSVTTYVRETTEAKDGVIVIVLRGNKGSGFSVQATAEVQARLPEVLRNLADHIERDPQFVAPFIRETL